MNKKIKFVFTAILLLITFCVACRNSTTASNDSTVVRKVSTPNTEKLSSHLASSWQMFRGGPALLGIAPGELPDSFSLHWKFKTGDSNKSSTAIGNGRVFIGSDDGKVYALEMASGQEVWSFQTEDTVESSPCLLNGSVFVGSSDSFLYALDSETGKLKWKYETEDKILGAVNWAPSPLIKGARGLSTLKGDAAWILVGSYDNKLHCVDSVTGKGIWVYETSNYINGAPAIAGSRSRQTSGKAVFGGCDGIIHVVSIADGKEITEIEAGSYIAGSAALAGENVYVGNYDGQFLCADINTNGIIWSYESKFPFFSSPAVGETQVIFGSRDKRLHCVKRESGNLLWTFQTRGKVDSSPVICGDKVVVGSDDGRLYVVSLADGKELWSYEIGDAVTGSPAVANGMIIIGSEDGYVYAFAPKP